MSVTLKTNPDPTRDTGLENDLPQSAEPLRAAQIGDSITLHWGGDRIKVTLLGLVDPAVVDNELGRLFDRFRGSPATWVVHLDRRRPE